jgi:hypothetical protein
VVPTALQRGLRSAFGHITPSGKPDNLKAGITKPSRHEPGIERTYQDLAAALTIEFGEDIRVRIAAPAPAILVAAVIKAFAPR